MPTFLVSEFGPLARSRDGDGQCYVSLAAEPNMISHRAVEADGLDAITGAVDHGRAEYIVDADSGPEAVGIVARLVNKPGEWIAREVEAVKVGLAVESG